MILAWLGAVSTRVRLYWLREILGYQYCSLCRDYTQCYRWPHRRAS